MLEASRGPYKIAWIIQCKDDIEKCTSRSFDPIGVILWRVYQSLHRLHQNGMKLSELIGLAPVSIAIGSTKIENLVKGSEWGDQVGHPSQIGSYLAPLLQMREVWKFDHRCHSLRWSFCAVDVFSPHVLLSRKNLQKMLIFDIFRLKYLYEVQTEF